jgi:hydrogenase-4 component B
MVLVVTADDGFFFLIVWEIMSLVSYLLVVTEHEKAETRYAGFFYLVMTHVGTAFILICYLVFYQQTGSFAFDTFRHPGEPLPEGFRTVAFAAAFIGFGAKLVSSPCTCGCLTRTPPPRRISRPSCPAS